MHEMYSALWAGGSDGALFGVDDAREVLGWPS